jgi:hypothetical protein
MDQQDRQAIENLFARLRDVERQGAPRDPQAEAFIRQAEARQPAASYYMAQTIIMQDLALQEAQRRIEELERGSQRQGGGVFSGLFGGGAQSARRSGVVPSVPREAASTFDRNLGDRNLGDRNPGQRGGGGFLAGAAQTAMGVAGGVLLGNMIGNMFGGHDTAAADSSEHAAEDTTADASGDEGGGFFDNFFGGGDDGGGDA